MSVTRRARKKPCQTVKTMCKSASITHCSTRKKIRMWQGKKTNASVMCYATQYYMLFLPWTIQANIWQIFIAIFYYLQFYGEKWVFVALKQVSITAYSLFVQLKRRKYEKKERKWFLFCWWKEEIIVYLQLKNHKNENLLMWFHQNVPYSNGAQHSIYCAIGRIYVKCGNSWKTWLSEILRL